MRMIALCCLLLIVGVLNVKAQDTSPLTTGEGDQPFKAAIAGAGYRLEVSSLIKALEDKDLFVASSAAELLPKLSSSRRVVNALSEVIANGRELQAVYAARSLSAVGVSTWAPKAIERLPRMADSLARLQLSGLLAKAGHSDGWIFVEQALVEGTLAAAALENADAFNGVRKKDGSRLRLVEELTALEDKVPTNVKPQIIEKVNRLRAASKHR